MDEIKRGDSITVRDARGRLLQRRAVSEVVDGRDFKIVWVSRPEEWDAAQAEGREPDATPWPAEDVKLAEAAAARPAR